MTENIFYWVFTLGITIVFSFVPEKYVKPAAANFPANSYKKAIFLHILLVTLLFLAVTLIVQRLVFASLAISIFLIILSGVSNAKYQALKEPLVFSDIAMFSQAFKHPRLYFPFLGLLPVILMPLLIISLIATILLIEPAMSFTWQRTLSTFIICGLCFVIAKNIALQLTLSEEPEIDNCQHGLLNSLFAYAIQANSLKHQQYIQTALTRSPFAIKNNEQKSEKTPPHFYGVSTKNHASDSIDSNSDSDSDSGSASILSQSNPDLEVLSGHSFENITVIQSESFFDARRLDESINKNVLENYDNCLKESLQFGKLDVPAWGANTMRTEFSFLTGFKYQDMGLYRYYPYQYLHKMPIVSLAKLLQSQGYHCVCIHPHPASFFGRDRIFPKMGFDEFIDIGNFENKKTFGPYISDQMVTDKILEISDKYDDKPLFIFAITMENHGPLHLEKTTKEEQKQYFSKIPFEDINDLTVYLRHLKNADKMLKQLTLAYTNIDKPTTLCFYGDHIPSMPKVYQKLSYDDGDSDYFIWNNKTSKQTNKPQSIRHDISVDSLATTLLKHSGNIKA